MKLKPIRNQVAVLMGASSGIGRQAAIDFAKRGAKVFASARDQEGLDSLAEEIRRAGGHVAVKTADTSDFEQVKAVADEAARTFGRIDTWVHAAAVTLYADFERTTPEEWKRIIDVNLNGQAYGAMAALPHLRKAGGGALIHISSVEARRAFPYQSAYAASKHGITGMLEALRMELKHERVPISVTEILPGSINTPLFDKARTKLGVKPVGPAPIYQPKLVSEAILHAAEHPIREFVVGGGAKMLKFTQEFAPGLTDRVLLRVGFEAQRTEQPKPESAPDNLFQPVAGFDVVEGAFSDRAASRSAFNWSEKHPIATQLVAVGALAALVAAAFRPRRP
jgi:NAD(P)-dependent dehydrogenase (short-subunit alcohol dehydrogenase family)